MKRWLLLAAVRSWRCTRRPLQVVDDRGVTVDLPQPPQRIVSLLPSLTEMVCALGACERLVGVDRYSNWPASVQKLPRVGGWKTPISRPSWRSSPTWCCFGKSSRALARLEALGLKVLALEPKTMGDVRRVLGKLGQVLAGADAPAVWERIDAGVNRRRAACPRRCAATTRVLRGQQRPLCGERGVLHRRDAGAPRRGQHRAGQLGPFPKLNPEFVVRADPQVIMICDRNAAGAEGPAGLEPHPRRCAKAASACSRRPQGDVLVRPGPRMAEAARLMVQCLQGQRGGQAP